MIWLRDDHINCPRDEGDSAFLPPFTLSPSRKMGISLLDCTVTSRVFVSVALSLSRHCPNAAAVELETSSRSADFISWQDALTTTLTALVTKALSSGRTGDESVVMRWRPRQGVFRTKRHNGKHARYAVVRWATGISTRLEDRAAQRLPHKVSLFL
jgi:hypothetical protein